MRAGAGDGLAPGGGSEDHGGELPEEAGGEEGVEPDEGLGPDLPVREGAPVGANKGHGLVETIPLANQGFLR